ncbi:hypothetical protein NL461_26715, partial [Klebsiella pneumoniae]|nr:hypothetical protein [Klebsiella pneumoniae]
VAAAITIVVIRMGSTVAPLEITRCLLVPALCLHFVASICRNLNGVSRFHIRDFRFDLLRRFAAVPIAATTTILVFVLAAARTIG